MRQKQMIQIVDDQPAGGGHVLGENRLLREEHHVRLQLRERSFDRPGTIRARGLEPAGAEDLPAALIDHRPRQAEENIRAGQLPIHQQHDFVLWGDLRQAGDEVAQVGFRAADLSRPKIEQAHDDFHRLHLGGTVEGVGGGERRLSDRRFKHPGGRRGRFPWDRRRRGFFYRWREKIAGRFALSAEHLHGGL